MPRIAVISFPGTNGEIDNLQTLRRCGFDAFFFRWNDARDLLGNVDGYFFGAGFSYEDRGRSGMIAGRDPLMDFIGQEAEAGKVVIGNCNGAQILVESGLIPLDRGLRMSLARNAIQDDHGWHAPGFLNEWVWITPACTRDRCATSDWSGTMHIPIAHGEGRFTTRDRDLIAELRKNDQLAFSYCDAEGNVSMDPQVTPNGSMHAIAGICNPAGNVVALMPHPERTENGRPYFASMKRWMERQRASGVGCRASDAGIQSGLSRNMGSPRLQSGDRKVNARGIYSSVPDREPRSLEIFIDMLITNNEERTVEQAARRIAPGLKLKQWKYLSPGSGSGSGSLTKILADLAVFNPNKERAFIRRNGSLARWNNSTKKEEKTTHPILADITLLRRDIPDTGATGLGEGGETGICYECGGIDEGALKRPELLEVFANPHASTLELLNC